MAEVRAAVRIRPAVRSGGPPLSIKGQYGQFAFDYVVEEGAGQEVTFTECILPQVNNFLQGTSSTVLVYGASSTGKSFTLEGGAPSSRTEGAIPRAMHAICKNLAVVPKHRYKLYVTYCALSAGMEAQMVDLLAPGSPTVSLKDSSASSALARLLHFQVENHEDIYEVLRQGRNTRAVAFGGSSGTTGGGAAGGSSGGPASSGGASGSSNGRSSRAAASASHVMLNIQLTGFAASGEQLATNLTFVELAAPESKDLMGYPTAADSGLSRSLSLAYTSLTAIITALRAGSGGPAGARGSDSPSRGHSHVPWRDSALTRWLKGCLDAAGSILVIATVAPGPEAAADTLATLSYVNRLRSGPKSDGLIVTATWDAADSASTVNLEATVTQQELQQSLQRAAQAQRDRQEREQQLQERLRDSRERERERFGSPIPVRPSPGGMPGMPAAAGSVASRSQSASRGQPSSPRRQDTDPHLQLPAVQPLRNAELASTRSIGSPPVLTSTSVGLQPQPQAQQRQPQQQAGQLTAGRDGPLAELLASLQLGNSSPMPQPRSSEPMQPPPKGAAGIGATGLSRLATSSTGAGLESGQVRTSDRGLMGIGGRGTASAGGAGAGGRDRDVEDRVTSAALESLSRQVEQLRAELGSERRECQRVKAELSSLEAAHRAASDLAEASTAAALGELRGQVEALRKQLETSEAAKQVLVARVQQLQEQQGSMLDLQAESSMLEAQVRALQDSLGAARSGQSSLAAQLADAKAAADALRQDRDRLQRQNHELSDKLQAQVRTLSEETSRLRSQALESAGQVEAEQLARRAAESALAQLRLQVEGTRGAEASALQQAGALAGQVKELSAALEAVRTERNKLQEAKWRAEERAEQLSVELEGAMTQTAKVEMEARAAATKAESDLRSAISAAEGFKAEITSTRAQMDSLKQELRAAQLAAEDAARRESTAQTDVQELEALLRELDRDLEVHLNSVWRQLRAERADSLFGVPEGGAVAPARRWRPVLQALLGVLKRHYNEAERQSQGLEQARERIASMEAQVARANELASSLAAHQQLKAAHLTELEESHRSIALMDQALTEANRECQRLHLQLEEVTAAHKALTLERAARESRLQSQATEREAALQAQVMEKEERLRATVAEHERRLQALTTEYEGRLAAQAAERDARLHSTVIDAEAKLQATLSEREARLVAAVADGEARLHKAVLDADARFHEAVSEREARLAALSNERDALQRQLSTLSVMQSEDKQERDMLRLRAHRRDHLLNITWAEVRAIKQACLTGGASSPSPTRAMAPPQSLRTTSPQRSAAGGVTLPVSGSPAAAVLDPEGSPDWEDPHCQERLIKGLTTVRVQVNKLHTELSGLRSGIGVSEELAGQLAAAKARLADSQRSVEELAARVTSLEAELREEQGARSSLQQQVAGHDATMASLQSALAEGRQAVAALQEEVAVITKSRDKWKETATEQEAQLRELYAEGEARAAELSRLRSEAKSATTEASGAGARMRLLESQLQDAKGQLETLSARLAATDKALSDANARAASLNGQLVLADSEARLKTQELLARVQAAEDGERLAKANAKEAMERLEVRLRDATEQGGKLVADLDQLRAERTEAQLRADDLQRHLAEARARLADLEHSAKQVHKLMSERDTLQDQINTLRNTNMQLSDEARGLRRTLDSTQEQLQRAAEEKMRLAAQLEGQRLEAIMNSMAPRTAGRIGALVRPGAVGADLSGGGTMESRGGAPAYGRAYTGLSYTGVGSYVPPPSVGASPSMPSVTRPAFVAGATTPYTPTTTTTVSNTPATSASMYEAAVKQAAGRGSYGGAGGSYGGAAGSYGGAAMADEPPLTTVRVHVRASQLQPQPGPPPAGTSR